jgi:hypothetical protein
MINFEDLSILLDEGDMNNNKVRNLVCELVRNENWFPIFCLSELVAREVSILVDAGNNISIDWGTIGRVTLSPPYGSVYPFKLWVHTHPRGSAYWSQTDLNSLSYVIGILDKAIVLGQDGILSTSLIESENQILNNIQPKFEWSKELVKSWLEISLNYMKS